MYRFLVGIFILWITFGPYPAAAQGTASVDDLASSIGLNAPAAEGTATDSGFADTGHTRAALISSVSRIAPSQPFRVMLRLVPDEGWHTYWRNPGDSGLPTTIEWDLPPGFEVSAIDWPAPHAVPYGPLTNYGYSGEARLLVTITPPAQLPENEHVTLRARSDWLVCADICIPEGTDHTLSLRTGGTLQLDEEAAPLFEAAEAEIPSRTIAADYGVKSGTLWLEVAAAEFGGNAASARFFPYRENIIENSAGQTTLVDGGTLHIGAPLRPGIIPEAAMKGVIAAGEEQDRIAVIVEAAPVAGAVPDRATEASTGAPAPAPRLQIGVLQALLYAFIGGLILNLMPCVFPVLSMKALAVVKSADADRPHRRAEGLLYTGGVLASFLVIAGALLVLRAGGEAIGWGFQLQSPMVIGVLAVVLFIVGLSLSGVVTLGAGLMGMGGSLAARPGHAGAFLTGVLAVVVATPCTVPFMAPALGFAVLQPTGVALAIFLSLGLGLAAPFLLITLVPAIGRLLPRPGPWMETFRQFLAFPMYATVIWLVWVLGRQTGMNGVAILLGVLVLVAFAVWAWRAGQGGKTAILGRGIAGVAILAAAYGISQMEAVDPGPEMASQTKAGAPQAEPWSQDRLKELQASGTPVFVNFTADWCLTCLANEQVAFSGGQVREFFNARGIVYLKADWTRRDETITAALQRFGRSGVPLYLYYGSKGGEPTVLPQVLTPGTVIEQIKQAEGS